jgi:hypothetical protein
MKVTGSTTEPTPEQFADAAAPVPPDERAVAWAAMTGLTVPQVEHLAAMRSAMDATRAAARKPS